MSKAMLAPRSSSGFLFWRISLSWQRHIAAALKPLQVTHVQFVLLASLKWLTEHGLLTNPSQRQLADHAGTDPMMTSTVLRSLEERGLVGRILDPNDARVRRIVLTVPGNALIGEALNAVERVDREFFGRVADQERMLEVLEALAPALIDQAPPAVGG